MLFFLINLINVYFCRRTPIFQTPLNRVFTELASRPIQSISRKDVVSSDATQNSGTAWTQDFWSKRVMPVLVTGQP